MPRAVRGDRPRSPDTPRRASPRPKTPPPPPRARSPPTRPTTPPTTPPSDETSDDGMAHPSPEPEPQPGGQSVGYRTCLDREFIQKEIRWARRYRKPIITVVEGNSRRPGFFDFEKARLKYDVPCTCGQNDETGHAEGCEREWKSLLDISAIEFQRNGYQWDGMLRHILDKAGQHTVDELPVKGDTYTVPAHRDGVLNPPGHWDFFLSHNQELGGDAMCNLSFLLEKQGKRSWYDNRMKDVSERAMEEGVEHSAAFVLFLTGKRPESEVRLEMKLSGNIAMPSDSATRHAFVVQFKQTVGKVVALADYTIDSWLSEKKFTQYAAAIKAAHYTELETLYHAEEAQISSLATKVGMPLPHATSFVKCCAELREVPERIQVVQIRQGCVIVAFDILPVGEKSVATKHTTVAIVATLKQLVQDASLRRQQSELGTEADSTVDGSTQNGAGPARGSQAADNLLSLLDPDHELIAQTSPAYAHEYSRANPRWIDDEECGMNCMLCSELFFSVGRGLTDKTRHHCRYCGWVLCGRCCPDGQKVGLDRWASSTPGHPIKGAKVPRLKRVCNVCFEIAPREVQARTELDLQLVPPRGYAWVKQPRGPFSSWPERFIELAYASGTSKAVMGLRVYASEGADSCVVEESLQDLRGKVVESGTESWLARGSYPKLSISNEFVRSTGAESGIAVKSPAASEESVFVFADEIIRDRFAKACSNLAAGRLWNGSQNAEAGILLAGDEAEAIVDLAEVDPRQQLIAIYTRHNPRKVADIDQMMAEWAGQPGGVAAMIPRVAHKYLRPPSPIPGDLPHEGDIFREPEPEPEPDCEPAIPEANARNQMFASTTGNPTALDTALEPAPEPEPNQTGEGTDST